MKSPFTLIIILHYKLSIHVPAVNILPLSLIKDSAPIAIDKKQISYSNYLIHIENITVLLLCNFIILMVNFKM